MLHLSYTGPLAGRRLCGAAPDAGGAIHAGYHERINPIRLCCACLDIWDAAIAEDDIAPEPDDFPALGPPDCPRCDGVGVRMGPLGRLFWVRCRACGHDFEEEV